MTKVMQKAATRATGVATRARQMRHKKPMKKRIASPFIEQTLVPYNPGTEVNTNMEFIMTTSYEIPITQPM
tara:strand:+ start:14354 stop:14566 length:213 start_codon:yes stop_codon:yes gene_type:complete